MSELLSINVNEHTEKKNGLTYLSWAWAWAEALKADPAARWEVRTFQGVPFCPIGDSAMVCVEVVLKGMARECWLPVMDNRNKAIKNPDAFAINTALMRCMTKALSMHGLGLYIYAGEDLPEGAPEPTADDALEATLAASIEMEQAKRREHLDELALEIIDSFRADRHGETIKLWFNDASFKDADERQYCWGLLKTESALRALLQANSPHRDHKPAPVIEMVSPGPGLKKIGKPITNGVTQ